MSGNIPMYLIAGAPFAFKEKRRKGETRKREKGKQTIRQLDTLVGSTLQKPNLIDALDFKLVKEL